MRISSAFPSNYIKCEDLQDRPVRVRMNFVKLEEIGSDHKPVLYFIGKEKGLVLNKTNASVISMIYGDDTDNWPEGEIELYPTETDYQGKRVPAIRVRPVTRRPNGNAQPSMSSPYQPDEAPANHAPPPAQESRFDRDMDDEIPF